MNFRWLPAALCLSLLPASLLAQDAHSLGIGDTATAAPMGIFGVVWNPAFMGVPDTGPSGWTIASGYSAVDTTNSGLAIVRYNPDDARSSSQDPIQRYQQYQGLF